MFFNTPLIDPPESPRHCTVGRADTGRGCAGVGAGVGGRADALVWNHTASCGCMEPRLNAILARGPPRRRKAVSHIGGERGWLCEESAHTYGRVHMHIGGERGWLCEESSSWPCGC